MRCELPKEPGIYAVILMIERDVSILTRGGKRFTIPRGVYLYIGSAMGGGGIRGRVERYLNRSGRVFWHIDHLLQRSSVKILGVLYRVYRDPGDHESELASKLREIFTGIPGFGCSDKPGNYSHLYLCGHTEDGCLGRIAGVADLAYCSLDML